MATTVQSGVETPGVWRKLLSDLNDRVSYSTPINKTVLLLSDSPDVLKLIINKLRSVNVIAKPLLFSSTKKQQQKSQRKKRDLIDSMCLSYTFLELPLDHDDPESETRILEIYCYPYTSLGRLDVIESFLKRFNEVVNLTVIDVIDFVKYGENQLKFSLDDVIKDNARMCQILSKIFASDEHKQTVTSNYELSVLKYRKSFSSAVQLEPVERSTGECECPLGIDYIVLMVGLETLNSLISINGVKQTEIDKLQQAMRVILLNVGGSIMTLSTLFDDDPTVKKSIDILANHLVNDKLVTPAEVDDNLNLVIPKGWDTWGKIKVLNQKFDCHRWKLDWEKIVMSPTTTTKDPIVQPTTQISYHDYIQDYHNFLKLKYQEQLERELALANGDNSESSVTKELYANSSHNIDEADISSASFHETHSLIQEFRAQFAQDANLLSSDLQSTPTQSRQRDDPIPGSSAAKFNEFFNDLLVENSSNHEFQS